MGLRGILLLAAVVIFFLGAVGVDFGGHVNLLYVGFACFAASFLVGDMLGTRRSFLRR